MKLSTFLACAMMFAFSRAQGATAQNPAVVELFTSQGCSSCPPANESLRAVADRPDVLALSFDVTYWDYLGWKDTFDDEAYTRRQRNYEPTLGESGPFTPQVVVDGAHDTVGNVRGDIEKLIAQSHRTNAPFVSLATNSVSVGVANGTADVWLVRYDPRVTQIPVSLGENAGATFLQKNVVRSLTLLGQWHGAAAQFPMPPAPPGLKTAVLVQKPQGGAILAAARD